MTYRAEGVCASCGKPIEQSGRGRPRKYCDDCRSHGGRRGPLPGPASERGRLRVTSSERRIIPSAKNAGMKICSACEVELPLDDFGKDRSRPDGHGTYCKPCSHERDRLRYQRKVEATGRKVGDQTAGPRPACVECGKPVRNRRKGKWCQCCSNECRYKHEGISEHADEPTRKQARRRKIVASGGLTIVSQRRLLHRWQRQGKSCWACGGPCETVDHVIPIKRGGSSFEGNLLPSCRACNGSRAHRLIIEWKHRPSPTISWPIGQNKPSREFEPYTYKLICECCGVEFEASSKRRFCEPYRCPHAESKTCSFEGGCDGPPVCDGLCGAHNQQRKAGKPLTPLRTWTRRTGTCDYCDEPINARSMCVKHYGRWQDGRPMVDPPEYTRDCDYCGVTFITNRAKQRFCTAAHRKAAYGRRKRGRSEQLPTAG